MNNELCIVLINLCIDVIIFLKLKEFNYMLMLYGGQPSKKMTKQTNT